MSSSVQVGWSLRRFGTRVSKSSLVIGKNISPSLRIHTRNYQNLHLGILKQGGIWYTMVFLHVIILYNTPLEFLYSRKKKKIDL